MTQAPKLWPAGGVEIAEGRLTAHHEQRKQHVTKKTANSEYLDLEHLDRGRTKIAPTALHKE
jgi:hypothetical protein